MKRHSVLLLALLLGASSAFAAEFNVEDYTREELIAINETVDARLAELNAQYAREHANRIITLDTEAPVLGTGKNLKVTATVAKVVDEAPDKTTLVWKSSNDKVARVSNGTVTAVAPGTAEITVSAKDDENVTASFTVSVVKLVTGVQLKEKTLSVPKKSTVTPNATVQPKDATNQALVWTSSDETVATVAEDGTITGVRGGECTVTATAADGSGKSASVKVKVLGALPFEFKNFQVKEIDYGAEYINISFDIVMGSDDPITYVGYSYFTFDENGEGFDSAFTLDEMSRYEMNQMSFPKPMKNGSVYNRGFANVGLDTAQVFVVKNFYCTKDHPERMYAPEGEIEYTRFVLPGKDPVMPEVFR